MRLHNCISVTPIIKKQTLENIHKMSYESKITYGIEVWGSSKAWKLYKVLGIFCNKLMGIPNGAVNEYAEVEICRVE